MPSEVEKRFYAEARVFFDEVLHDAPTLTTYFGDHRYVARLADFGRAGLDDQRGRLGRCLEAFQGYRAGLWSRRLT